MKETTAIEMLAGAHQTMSRDEIAAHALELADAIEAQAKLNASLAKLLRAMHTAKTADLNAQRVFAMEVRHAASLFASGRLSDGAALVRRLASAPLPPTNPPLEDALFLPPPPASMFNPVGGHHG